MRSKSSQDQITLSVSNGPEPLKTTRSGELGTSSTQVGVSALGHHGSTSSSQPLQIGGYEPPPGQPPPQRSSRSKWMPRNRPGAQQRCQQMQLENGTIISDYGEDQDGRKEHKPIFCALAFVGCLIGFVVEIAENDWKMQPFTCGKCADGSACNEDGTPCEANILFGPSYETMKKCGGKLDYLIFEEGEWYRVISCNWLHGGLFHLLMNMVAVYNLGVPLERSFGPIKLGALYLLSGLFGTIVSCVFLPGVLSVGASASVFGLVGACWADVILNYCARGTLKDSMVCSLFVSTIVNVLIGLTPFVDNFMHMGGFVAGIVVGMILFSKKHPNAEGVLKYRQMQRNIIFVGVLCFIVLFLAALSAAFEPEARENMRQCSFCKYINCVEPTAFTGEPWWDCCSLASREADRSACTLSPDDVTNQCFCVPAEVCVAGFTGADNYTVEADCLLGTDGCSTQDASWCQNACSGC